MPLRSELDEAILAPAKLRLVPPHLHGGQIVTVSIGQGGTQFKMPHADGGSYAVVYKFQLPSGKFSALRCFYHDVGAEMRDRYRRLGDLLKKTAPTFTVDFRYFDRGIKLASRAASALICPLVEMEWVDGHKLLKEVGRLADARDATRLRQLAKKWEDLVVSMGAIGMAHGDLSGENVLVRANGELVLVDYDGVYLPDPLLEKRPPGESGNPDYQHPSHRASRIYDSYMDDFSALVVYVAILALCERPELFRKYVNRNDKDEIVAENLLFQADDFKKPGSSGIFRDLDASHDEEVRRVASILRKACTGPIGNVPDFAEVVGRTGRNGRRRRQRRRHGIPRVVKVAAAAVAMVACLTLALRYKTNRINGRSVTSTGSSVVTTAPPLLQRQSDGVPNSPSSPSPPAVVADLGSGARYLGPPATNKLRSGVSKQDVPPPASAAPPVPPPLAIAVAPTLGVPVAPPSTVLTPYPVTPFPALENYVQPVRTENISFDLAPSVKLELILVPAGEFLMGSDDFRSELQNAKPRHWVQITRPFHLGKNLVTQEQWRAIMGENPGVCQGPTYPVNAVSWDDCQRFLERLNAALHPAPNCFRLPTEAQWEYACRAGSKSRFYFGDNESELGEYAWYDQNARGMPHPVGVRRPNDWGLYDMHGNQWEWCADWYEQFYSYAPPLRCADPTGPLLGRFRVIRGGCSNSNAVCCCAAIRGEEEPGFRNSQVGFRVALVSAEMPAADPRQRFQPSAPPTVDDGRPLAPLYPLVQVPRSNGNGPMAGPDSAPFEFRRPVPSFDFRRPSQGPVTPDPAGLWKNPQPDIKETSFELAPGIGLVMALIPPGEFPMGSPASDKDAAADEKPQHRVRITKPFYLGKYKVTQEQWQAVMDDGKLASLFTGIRNPSRFKGPTNPVDMVSWQDCQQFLDRLNGRIGAGRVKFQLPTEAQWEYACRAGSTTRYCFGDDAWQLDAYAWYGKNAKGASHPVGEKRSNGWGLHDMYGSQWEWCADWYEQTYYHYLPPPGGWCDPAGPPKGLYRVIRGGSWGSGDAYCRSAVRGKESPGFRNNGVGFRVAMILPGEVPLPVEPKLAQPVASRALWGGRPITRASALEEAPLWNGNTSP